MIDIRQGGTLGDFAGLQRGTTYKSKLLGTEGPWLLGLACIARNGGFKADNLKTYGGPSDPKILVGPGDILVSLKDVTQAADLLGSVVTVPASIGQGRLTQDTVKLVFDDDFSERNYIYWLLRTPQARDHCRRHATGTTNLGLAREDFLAIEVPPLDEGRESLLQVLQALDDKIELNRRMNETLEAQARALFRDWFVDFGPVKAKMAGTASYLAPDLWSLFPKRLDDDGVPDGWKVKPLDKIADFLNGLALQKFPASAGEESLPVIKIAELRTGPTLKSNRASTDVPAKYVIDDGDFIFSWSGSLVAKFWTHGLGALNQHLFKVTSDEFPPWFYSHWVWHHLAEFQLIAASKATTMGHIKRGHLKEAMCVVPTSETLERLTTIFEPLVERTIANELESRTLAKIRDLLLPKLMSGELRVRRAERQIEEAL